MPPTIIGLLIFFFFFLLSFVPFFLLLFSSFHFFLTFFLSTSPTVSFYFPSLILSLCAKFRAFDLGEDEFFSLLGFYIALVRSCLPWDGLPVPSSRVRQPKKMEPIGCPETSINNYQTTLRKPEKSGYLLLRFSLNFILRLSSFSSYIFSAYLSTSFFRFLSTRFSIYLCQCAHYVRLLSLKCHKVRSRLSNYYDFTLTLISCRSKRKSTTKNEGEKKAIKGACIKGRK